MKSYRSSYALRAVFGAASVFTASVPAMAADIYDGGLKGGYEVAAPPSDRGFYVKGYIGQANPDTGNMWNEVYDTNNFTVFHNDIKSSPLFGIGVGWQARSWLRFDLTGEYRGDASYFGSDSHPAIGGGDAGTNEYTADMKTWLGLANAYIDMGNWWGFTPFIGAGIGFSSISIEGLKDVNVPTAGVAFGQDKTTSNFAWAAYAGFSYEVTAQTALELTYRYVDLGNAQSGVVTTYDGTSSYGGHYIKDITSNDFMLGVRYKLQREPVVYSPVK